ncbi:hypothetical protein SUGI_0796580 [Cryptomeria japonica]|uniref:RING-H2 finger protein ATL78 n=1 Tax=Cryptomeria japonica TaxID=3369 RepID=UPI002414CD11|nr:RING-H2 finger protein ATL78 [Cryptomeria japonica]GLJ39078.1 hypothetical protein SUGI_0796580 [Cryptomeria japonica]
MSLSNRKLKGCSIHGRSLLQPTSPSSSSVRHSTWQPDIAIIVSVLLCVIILVLIFASVLRRGILRRRRQMAAGGVNRGMEMEDLKVLPTMVFSQGLELPGKETGCAICLAEFQQGEELRALPTCNHGFHVRCIDTWLVSNSSCPSCRNHLGTGEQKIYVKEREVSHSFLP